VAVTPGPAPGPRSPEFLAEVERARSLARQLRRDAEDARARAAAASVETAAARARAMALSRRLKARS